jgi:hypothetical protein
MQDCYRNGLDGGRDMRSFSGLYFFLRMIVYIVVYVTQSIAKKHVSEWYSAGVVLLIATLTMALVQPYKKVFMNYLDVFLLSVLTIQCLTLPLKTTWSIAIVRALFTIPFVVVVVFVVWRSFKGLTKWFCIRRATPNVELPQSSALNTGSASQSIHVVHPINFNCTWFWHYRLI